MNEMHRRELEDGTRIIESAAWWIQRRGDMLCICEQRGKSDEENASFCRGCVPVADLLYLLEGVKIAAGRPVAGVPLPVPGPWGEADHVACRGT